MWKKQWVLFTGGALVCLCAFARAGTWGVSGVTDSIKIFLSNGSAAVYAVDDVSKITFSGLTGIADVAIASRVLSRLRLYPNPTRGKTVIEYQHARDGMVTVSVFNIMGQRVRTLTAGIEKAGSHSVTWDSRDERGTMVAAGVYLGRVETVGNVRTSKLIVIK
jgi:flagellar hook assembly protein FlgD